MVSLVLFTTTTCQHCKPVKAYLEEINKEYGIDIGYRVVDTSADDMAMADHWNVTGVPTLLVINDAEEKHRFVGANPKSEVLDVIRSLQPDLFQEPSGGKPEGSDSLLCGISQQKD